MRTWLTSSFTKFSTKSRGGKGSDIWQPPHNIRFRGKCDLEIGPHVFYATSVYEVTYQPYSVPVQTPLHYNQSYTTLSTPLVPLSQPHGAPALAYAPSTTAVVSSLKGSVPITPDFIAQVNAAAGSNPTLANLLGLAASGSATTEQLQTLGVTIQSLADNVLKTSNHQTGHGSSTCSRAQISIAGPSKAAVPPPAFTPPITKLSNSSSAPQQHVLSLRPQQAQSSIPASGAQAQPLSQQQSQEMQVIHKDSDVVIEFYENSYDRWTLPKNLVLYERVKRWDGNSSLADIIFSTTFPFEGSKPAVASIQSGEPSRVFNDAVHPITLRFFNVPPAIWNLFAQVAEDEERTKRVKASIDSQLDKAAPRSYLQYRIPDSTLLTQLQASASDRYPTKTIRPAVQASGATQTKRRASAILKGGTSAVGPTPKRKRTMTRKTESRTGTCDICKRASIVLAPDSRKRLTDLLGRELTSSTFKRTARLAQRKQEFCLPQ
ncbi:hypothetical protein K439DRAFT_205288 [Ramaria rubella]|nr:hypothetical protein K439DRAFT_205288 [Ramaria rubella]